MDRKWLYFTVVVSMALLAASASQSVSSVALRANALTSYYNLQGFEGIPTIGGSDIPGAPPPVVDYVSTWCRYINVPNTQEGDYYLNYPLHLPNGANITDVSLRLADYNSTGNLKAFLVQRPWNSASAVTTISHTETDNTFTGEFTVSMGRVGGLPVKVDNQTFQYWVMVTPANGASPGQLCTYSVHVKYTIDGAFLPAIQKGN